MLQCPLQGGRKYPPQTEERAITAKQAFLSDKTRVRRVEGRARHEKTRSDGREGKALWRRAGESSQASIE